MSVASGGYLPRRFAASVNTTNTSHLRDLQVTTSCGYPVLVRLQISKKNPTSKKVRLALNCGGSRGGARGPGSPLIFRPNCGWKGWKKILRPPPPPMSGSGWPSLPPPPPAPPPSPPPYLDPPLKKKYTFWAKATVKRAAKTCNFRNIAAKQDK